MVKIKIISLLLFLLTTSSLHAQVQIKQSVGIAHSESLRGWYAINPPYDLSNPAQYDVLQTGSLLYAISIEKRINDWSYGVGANLNIRSFESLFESDNTFDVSLLRLGRHFSNNRSVHAILGTSIFFENEVSFGTSLSIEVQPGFKVFDRPISFKWQFAYTDYEVGPQGTVDARRYGYTGYLGLLIPLSL